MVWSCELSSIFQLLLHFFLHNQPLPILTHAAVNVSLTSDLYRVSEGEGEVVVMLELSEAAGKPVSVSLVTSPGSASGK